jgi:hypothetical protein
VKKPKPPLCCGKRARLTSGAEVYPYRPDLRDKPIWKCDGCGGYVGCHPGTQKPLGIPANAELRQARMLLHERIIDPIWKTADQLPDYRPEDGLARHRIRQTARVRVYSFLADRLGIDRKACHTGMFDLEQCRAAWRALRGVTYQQIREWAHERRQKEAA